MCTRYKITNQVPYGLTSCAVEKLLVCDVPELLPEKLGKGLEGFMFPLSVDGLESFEASVLWVDFALVD
jgi:hypothetical protein